MKKTIIAIWGSSQTGKTSTIKLFYKLLRERNPDLVVVHEGPTDTIDIRKVARIGNLLVGIESQGDPNGRIFDSLEMFDQLNCDIIICGTRTSGGTVDEVTKYENTGNYDVIWFSNLFSGQKNTQLLNERSAEIVHSVFTDLKTGKY